MNIEYVIQRYTVYIYDKCGITHGEAATSCGNLEAKDARLRAVSQLCSFSTNFYKATRYHFAISHVRINPKTFMGHPLGFNRTPNKPSHIRRLSLSSCARWNKIWSHGGYFWRMSVHKTKGLAFLRLDFCALVAQAGWIMNPCDNVNLNSTLVKYFTNLGIMNIFNLTTSRNIQDHRPHSPHGTACGCFGTCIPATFALVQSTSAEVDMKLSWKQIGNKWGGQWWKSWSG